MICDLVIPALNESSNITALFESLAPLRDGGGAQSFVVRNVVLADNGSTDDTDSLGRAAGAVVVHEPQRGYGAACLKALEWIAAQDEAPETVVFLDADLSDDPAAMPELLAPLASADVEIVIGSRVRLAEPGALNAVQRFGNGIACALIALLAGRHHTDLGPFRAVRWATLERLAMADRTWGWTVELQMKAGLLEIPAVEVDVPYRNRRSGRSKISGTVRGVVTAGSKIIFTILALWWRRDAIRSAAGNRG